MPIILPAFTKSLVRNATLVSLGSLRKSITAGLVAGETTILIFLDSMSDFLLTPTCGMKRSCIVSPGLVFTNVPLPLFFSMKPSYSSFVRAWRRVTLLEPYSSHSWNSDGSCMPISHSPEEILESMSEEICWYSGIADFLSSFFMSSAPQKNRKNAPGLR